MLLSYYKNDFIIPHTSICNIKQSGRIYDKKPVTITSPVFSSIDFTSGALNISTTFDVIAHIDNKDGYIDIESDTQATLVCDDNDVFRMYVKF